MKIRDIIRMATGNLRRSKLRNVLTLFGIIIAIGAMVALLSFGAGMQRTARTEFAKRELLTAIKVLPKNADSLPLTEESVEKFRTIPGVEIVYPEIVFPTMAWLEDKKSYAIVRGLPAELGELDPYSNMEIGRFFSRNDTNEAILSTKLVGALKLESDEVIDKEITAMAVASEKGKSLPIMRQEKFKVIGIIESMETYLGNVLFIPIGTARGMSEGVFRELEEILDISGAGKGYPMVHIRAKTATVVEKICEKVEEMGYKPLSLQRQFKEMRIAFLIMNSVLGGIGAIGLLIACLGIINTMVTSVLERTKEIGIMKAVGARNKDIRNLYFAETGIIGFWGGVFGVVLGWLVTRIIQPIVNFYMVKYGGEAMDLFYTPIWLIAGAIGFAVLVSLVAGFYPARRAMRIDTVQALRYE
jgi:putative ABC transport system permease protein